MHESSETYELLSNHDESEMDEPSRKYQYPRKRYSGLLVVCLFIAVASATLFTVDYLAFRTSRGLTTVSSSDESLLSTLWPVGLPNRTDSWENENSKAMRALLKCISQNNCGQNQTSLVLLSSEHFSSSIAGTVSGEDIWATSVILALKEMGYTAIFAPNNHELARTYRQYPSLVKVIILEGSASQMCMDDPNCIKTAAHPLGIPAWKMLSFHFWGGSAHPLGNAWTLSPENYGRIQSSGVSADNVYLGYSIERTCMKVSITPPDERPNQVYILAKYTSYFYDKYAWPNVSFVNPPIPLAIIAGVVDTTGQPLLDGITNLGRMNQTTFYKNLGHSRALIGIGRPGLSPSPYDALCMAVPFINPISVWDPQFPDDRYKWQSQHDGLKFENPPYVYNVRQNDEKGFWDAVAAAIENPIERYIVPAMTMESLKLRVGQVVEKDWKSKAQALLDERKATGKGVLFEM